MGSEEEGTAPGELSATTAAERAREQVCEVTDLRPDTVTSVAQRDGGWEVEVELVELARLPASTDVLGTYLVDLDDQGRLRGFERTRRYLRTEARRDPDE